MAAFFVLLASFKLGRAATLVWTNTGGGLWGAATNWSPNLVPSGADVAIITNAGTYTLTNNATLAVARVELGLDPGTNLPVAFPRLRHTAGTLTITNFSVATNAVVTLSAPLLVAGSLSGNGQMDQGSSSFRLLGAGFLGAYNFSGGEQRGGVLTVNRFNWSDGNLYSDAAGDRLVIAVGGVFNYTGNSERYLSYYSGPGRRLDNHGTWNWNGAGSLRGQGGAVVNNLGTVNVTTNSQFNWGGVGAAPVWNNFGTIIRNAGNELFYFNSVYLTNHGGIYNSAGALSIYNSVFTNGGVISVTGSQLQFWGSTGTNNGSVSVGMPTLFTVESGSAVGFGPAASLSVPGFNQARLSGGAVTLNTTNISAPSLWINGAVVYQQTNIVVPVINQSAGSFQLQVPATLATYNLTNGELRGRDLTVTNFTWIDGNLNNRAPGEAGGTPDRTIIPPGGVLNFMGSSERFLSYYVVPGRGLDNHGTWHWSSPGSLRGQAGAVVNNHGTVNVVTNSQFNWGGAGAAPVWNNFGTFHRNAGTNTFYFNGVYLNNSGGMDIQSGILSFYSSTVTNLASGSMQIQPNALLFNEQGAVSTFDPGSVLNVASHNALRLASGTVYLRSAAITAPSLWINGGTVIQDTANPIPEINQSGGVWRPLTALNIPVYNFTNGELRGADLSLDTFNWLGGALNADGPGSNLVTVATTLNLSSATPKSMSYWTQPGRSLINNGTATWSGASITGQGAATFRNNGSLTTTGDVAFVFGGSGGAAVFHNTGSYTRADGGGVANFGGTVITNSGSMTVNRGGFAVSGPFVQTSGSAHLGTNFSANGGLRIEAGTFTGRGGVAGALYNNGTLNPGASPGLIAGATFTNTAASVLNVELGGATAPGTNYDQIRLSGAATLGGVLNVSFANNFAPTLSNRFTILTTPSRAGTFSGVVPPPGVTLNTIYSTTNVVLEVVGLSNAPLEILSFPSNQTIWTPDPVTFAVSVSGVTPISYQWQRFSTNLPNATNSSFSIPAVAVSDAGLYTVQITDGLGGTTNATATLTVIPFAGTIYWTNVAGGDWSVASNWQPHRVPNATNTAMILSNGNYTVNINSAAAVSNLVVGLPSNPGTQTVHLVSGNTLMLGGNATFNTNTVLALNGTLQTAGGSNYIGGRIDWQTGTLSGAGRTVIATNATILFIGSLNQKFVATNILENYGTFTYTGDSFGHAQLLRFSGGAHLTNHLSGVINLGANALQYTGAQTPRSYLVNHGKIVAATTTVWSPSTIGVDFINYGLVENYSYLYLSRGNNFGTMWAYNYLTEISIFGDPDAGEYFSFEPGTELTGAGPNIKCGGLVQWNAPNAVHAGGLGIGQGSGGATFANAEFKILANYTNTATVSINRGALTITNPAVITDLHSYADSFVSFWSFAVTNAGTMYVNHLSHTIHSIGNGGSIIVRSNLALSGGSTYGPGHLVITNGATGTFSGGSVDAQRVLNYGTNNVTGGLSLSGNAFYHNRTGARTYFGGGSLGGAPAAMLNEGLMDGYGGVTLNLTNRATVLANDPLNRNLALGTYVQETGLTESGPGSLSGALDILGGTLLGTNAITGSLRNAATLTPGKPFGLLSVSGDYTNRSAGLETLVIGSATASSGFPRVAVGGTAHLGGTLSVAFTNGFEPVPGNLFTVMVFNARSGVFDQIINPTYQLEAFYTPTNLVLRAENLLPTVNLAAIGGNTQLVCMPFKITASASDADGVVTNLTAFLNGSPLASGPGGPLNAQVESDFPATLPLTARATDDRGGVRWVTQHVQMTTLPLHVLSLGGDRSNGFKICMLGETDSNYLVLAATNVSLPPAGWSALGTMEATNGIWRYFDAGTITNRPARFYRAQRQ